MVQKLLLHFMAVICVGLVRCRGQPVDCTKVMTFGEKNYSQESITSLSGWPEFMTYDFQKGDLYFSVHNIEDDKYSSYSVKLFYQERGSEVAKEFEFNKDAIPQAIGIDNKNNMTYIGTNHGLYTAGNDSEIKFIGYRKMSITSLTVSSDGEHVYFITLPKYAVFKYEPKCDAKKRVRSIRKAYQMVIDSEYNIFYENESDDLYKLSPDQVTPMIYPNVFINDSAYHSFAVDKSDNIYITVGTTISLLTSEDEIKWLGDFSHPVGQLVFDQDDNMIIGTEDNIYRLNKMDEEDRLSNC